MKADIPEWQRNFVFVLLTLMFALIFGYVVYSTADKYSNDKEQDVHQESNNNDAGSD